MAKKYNLYDFLFEDASIASSRLSPPRIMSRLERMAKREAEASALRKKENTGNKPFTLQTPEGLPGKTTSGKVGVNAQDLLRDMQGNLKRELPSIEKIATELNVSPEDIKKAEKAIEPVKNMATGIVNFHNIRSGNPLFQNSKEEKKPSASSVTPKKQEPAPPAKPAAPEIGRAHV